VVVVAGLGAEDAIEAARVVAARCQAVDLLHHRSLVKVVRRQPLGRCPVHAYLNADSG
jgi:hypothetical protein